VAVKIVRQANSIALLGVPTSAAAMSAGHEAAPAALRSAGLIDRLKLIGYEVTDLGDDPPRLFEPDEESPRARNLVSVIAALETLKPRVEQAVKSAALPLIIGGDCSIALAVVAGARRYYRNVGLIYVDRHADLNTPATTPSGCLDGMVVSHLTGRGAAELVRFWGEPPLVREPDLALFGVDRLDPSEEEVLHRVPLRRYMAADVKGMGAAVAAREAIERVHGNAHEFVLHFDVDVISDFSATNYPAGGGLTLEEVHEALVIFAQEKNLAAIEVTAYNPAKDPNGSGAKIVIDLLAAMLEQRLAARRSAAQAAEPMSVASDGRAATRKDDAETESMTQTAAGTATGSKSARQIPAAEPGEAWSSDSLDGEPAQEESEHQEPTPERSAPGEQGSSGENSSSGDKPTEHSEFGESQN